MFDRSQLVHQWQDRLAAAEGLADGTPRFRWYHAARIRLYRFLLRCYGSGEWRSALKEAVPPARQEVAGQAEGESWRGKPPKAEGKIRSVLKSVHLAQDEAAHKSGPKLAGVGPRDYVAVTANDAMIDVGQCREFLKRNGISARIAHRGRQKVVEVPFADLAKASYLVDTYAGQMRPVLKTAAEYRRQFPLIPNHSLPLFWAATIFGPLVGICVAFGGAVIASAIGTDLTRVFRSELEALTVLFLTGYLAVFALAYVRGFLRPLSPSRTVPGQAPIASAGRGTKARTGPLGLRQLVLLSACVSICVALGTSLASVLAKPDVFETVPAATIADALVVFAAVAPASFALTLALCLVVHPSAARELVGPLFRSPVRTSLFVAAVVTAPLCVLPVAIIEIMLVNALRLSGQVPAEAARPILICTIFLTYVAVLWWIVRRRN